MDMPPPDQQEQYDAIMFMLTKISWELFKHYVESML